MQNTEPCPNCYKEAREAYTKGYNDAVNQYYELIQKLHNPIYIVENKTQGDSE